MRSTDIYIDSMPALLVALVTCSANSVQLLPLNY
jgi:hypothetical protein